MVLVVGSKRLLLESVALGLFKQKGYLHWEGSAFQVLEFP